MIRKITIGMMSLVLLMALSCKKKEAHEEKFTANLTQLERGVTISWDAVTLSGYKNVNIYRSTSPIPDPGFSKAIDPNLLIVSITDKTITSFTDSNITLSSGGIVYYKLILNLGNRFLISNEVSASFNAFSLVVSASQFSSNTILSARIPELNMLYIMNYNQGLISAVDYSQKKVIASANASFNFNLVPYAIVNSGKPELYIYSNNSITCFDGQNLSVKFIVAASNIADYKVKNNYLYILTNSPSIKTYDISTHSFLSEKFFYYPTGSYSYNSGLLASGNFENSVYLKYYSQYYIGSQYYYKNHLLKFNLLNNVPNDTVSMQISKLNLDTTSAGSLNTDLIELSPDGKYLTCNKQGDIYDLTNQSFHSVQTTSNYYPSVVYSPSGNYLLGKTVAFSGITGTMDVFSVPGFVKIKNVSSLNPAGSNSLSLADDYLDNDTLVSYNVKQTFQSSQSVCTLTVLFKKID